MISDRSILKVALKGAVSATKDLIEMFRALDSYEIMCILENNGSKIGQDIAGVRVVPTIEVRKAYRKGTLDAVVMPGNLGTKTLASMARELRSMGVRSDDLYVAVSPPLGTCAPLVRYADWHALDYIEFHVSHVCNLNCKGCCHFSSLTKQKLPDYDEWDRGITRLKELVPYIKEIHLLGGEPLINPELPRYALRTRDLYPNAKIVVVSNALLADRLTDETIDVFRKTDIKVSITAYPGVFDKIEKGIAFLQAHGVLGNVHTATEFTKMLSRNKQPFPYQTTEYVCHCPNLVGTKLYACPLIAYLPDFNAQFHLDFPTAGGCVDLMEENMTFEKLREDLYRPFPLCEQCRSYLTEGIRAANDDSLSWSSYKPGETPAASDWLLEK